MDTNVQEIWKPIPNYPEFMVSNIGRVKKLEYTRTDKMGFVYKYPEKILAANHCGKGYLKCDLCYTGKIKHNHKVHRLVAMAFIENPNNYPQINHINGIKDDNRVENLEWCNNSINQLHAYKMGLSKPKRGEKNKWSKIVLNELTGIYYTSAKEAYDASSFKITYFTFCHKLNGKLKNNNTNFIYV